MTNRVRDWMSSPVIVIDPDSSVAYALTLMRRRNIHSLIVAVDPNTNNFGILTTTDIRDKIIASEQNPAEIQVKQIMSNNIVTADPEWSLKDCSLHMQKYNVHHLPVVNQDNMLVGIISVTDLFIAAEEIGWDSND